MNKALLDTDTLSEIGKGVRPSIVRNAKAYRRSFGRYTLSAVSVMQVISGHQRQQRQHRISAFLSSIAGSEIIVFDQPIAELAGRIAGDLIRTGQLIGSADVMIAGTAIVHGLELVTGNTRHFERVQRLGYPITLVNWRN